MKKILALALVLSSILAVGCQNNSVQADPTDQPKRTLPPGQKPKDVLMPINK